MKAFNLVQECLVVGTNIRGSHVQTYGPEMPLLPEYSDLRGQYRDSELPKIARVPVSKIGRCYIKAQGHYRDFSLSHTLCLNFVYSTAYLPKIKQLLDVIDILLL